MSRTKTGNELIPSARRLVKSLRDMGYDFAAAVADLIDNSIEARATLVAIDIEFDGDDFGARLPVSCLDIHNSLDTVFHLLLHFFARVQLVMP